MGFSWIFRNHFYSLHFRLFFGTPVISLDSGWQTHCASAITPQLHNQGKYHSLISLFSLNINLESNATYQTWDFYVSRMHLIYAFLEYFSINQVRSAVFVIFNVQDINVLMLLQIESSSQKWPASRGRIWIFGSYNSTASSLSYFFQCVHYLGLEYENFFRVCLATMQSTSVLVHNKIWW